MAFAYKRIQYSNKSSYYEEETKPNVLYFKRWYSNKISVLLIFWIYLIAISAFKILVNLSALQGTIVKDITSKLNILLDGLTILPITSEVKPSISKLFVRSQFSKQISQLERNLHFDTVKRVCFQYCKWSYIPNMLLSCPTIWDVCTFVGLNDSLCFNEVMYIYFK